MDTGITRDSMHSSWLQSSPPGFFDVKGIPHENGLHIHYSAMAADPCPSGSDFGWAQRRRSDLLSHLDKANSSVLAEVQLAVCVARATPYFA